MARYKVLRDRGPLVDTTRLTASSPVEPVFLEEGTYSVRGMGSSVDEGRLAEGLIGAMADWDSEREKSDADFSLLVHQRVGVSRRDAADRDLWTCLNATVAWPYTVWRWSNAGVVGRDRVSGSLDRSALGRLWWMAELVGGGTDEERLSRLRTLLKWQDRAVQLYERPRLLRRTHLVPDLISISRELADEWTERGYRRFAASVRAGFGVRLPAVMATDELRGIIEARARLAAEE